MSDNKRRLMALREAKASEQITRRNTIRALQSLREFIDVSLAGLDRDDGLNDAVDVTDLSDACTAARQMATSHAEAYDALARLEMGE